MKRILFTVCMLLGCVLFTMAQEDSYKIEGKLANTVNGKLLLVANTDKGMLDIGEATVTNGPDAGIDVGLPDAGKKECRAGFFHARKR